MEEHGAVVVETADRLVANTTDELRELVDYYDADPAHADVVPPGADLEQYTPGRWGPDSAHAMLARDGRSWRRP